jgi:hypothetical protein
VRGVVAVLGRALVDLRKKEMSGQRECDVSDWLNRSTTDQIRQNLSDFWFSCDVDAEDCDDVGLEEKWEGRETEAHVCQIFSGTQEH